MQRPTWGNGKTHGPCMQIENLTWNYCRGSKIVNHSRPSKCPLSGFSPGKNKGRGLWGRPSEAWDWSRNSALCARCSWATSRSRATCNILFYKCCSEDASVNVASLKQHSEEFHSGVQLTTSQRALGVRMLDIGELPALRDSGTSLRAKTWKGRAS